jgi:uncharacterized protein DUF6314
VPGVTTPGPCWPLAGGTLEFLRGSWRAERELADYRSGDRGSFRGIAVFAAATEAGADDHCGLVSYREQGELRLGGHTGPASRSLLYQPGNEGSAEVLFADGRPFYVLDLRTGYWRAEHPCGADHYLVTVRVLGANCFTEQWRARGPWKDYEMTTTLARIGAAE